MTLRTIASLQCVVPVKGDLQFVACASFMTMHFGQTFWCDVGGSC
jgi:hypothetical protein